MSTDERSYQQGSQGVWQQLLSLALQNLSGTGEHLSRTEMMQERTMVVQTLRSICEEYGDNDWDDDLHLTDVLNKHLLPCIQQMDEDLQCEAREQQSRADAWEEE